MFYLARDLFTLNLKKAHISPKPLIPKRFRSPVLTSLPVIEAGEQGLFQLLLLLPPLLARLRDAREGLGFRVEGLRV